MLKVSSPLTLRCLLALLSACALVPALHAQSSESDLKARLMDKPLYLRGCWRDDTLQFDSSGQLKRSSGVVSFTLGGFDLKTLHLKKDKLVLEGRRVGLELGDNKQLRVPLNVGKLGSPEDESIHIDIAASPNGDYGPALDAIFADGLAELAPSLPSYWRVYATKNFIPVDSAVPSSTKSLAPTKSDPIQQSSGSPETKPGRVGPGVKAPTILRMTEPEFNDAARKLKYGGNVLINFWVSPDGTVSHLSLLRPVGLGLDEHALAALQKYVFSPATLNDKPILVELNVEINFRIF
jgi:TonB family protein